MRFALRAHNSDGHCHDHCHCVGFQDGGRTITPVIVLDKFDVASSKGQLVFL